MAMMVKMQMLHRCCTETRWCWSSGLAAPVRAAAKNNRITQCSSSSSPLMTAVRVRGSDYAERMPKNQSQAIVEAKRFISFNRYPERTSLTTKSARRDVFGYKHFESGGNGGRGGGRFRTSNFFIHLLNNPQMRRIGLASGCAFLVTYVYTLEQVPVTGRYHNIILSVDAERALGRRVYNQVKQEAQQSRTLLPDNDARVMRVRRVGRRVAKAVERLRRQLHETSKRTKHLDRLEWEFSVVHSPQVNAFVVPGGKVCVFTGLLNKCRTDDELATVIGHEAAHVIARHTAENITHNAIFTALKLMIALALDISMIGSATIAVLFELPLSRRNELEADRIGLSLMADACYNPKAAPRVYAMLGGGDRMAKFLCTHPPSKERVQQIKALLPKAENQYLKNDCGRLRYGLFSV